jgi:hypothetical protein
MSSTHFFSLAPSTGSSIRSGHSHCPSLSPAGAEGRALGPLFEIGRVEDDKCSLIGEHRNHDPLMLRLVPEDIGIAEVGRVKVSHGIARIVCPGSSAIVAEGDVLFLSVLVRRRVDRD